MALIELTGVGRHYRLAGIDVPALEGVDLTIEAGEFVVVPSVDVPVVESPVVDAGGVVVDVPSVDVPVDVEVVLLLSPQYLIEPMRATARSSRRTTTTVAVTERERARSE